MGDIGIKISKEGKDISSVDKQDISLSSNYNYLKPHMKGTCTVTCLATDNELGQVTEITHNLGYIPAVETFLEASNGYLIDGTSMSMWPVVTIPDAGEQSIIVEITTTKLKIRMFNGDWTTWGNLINRTAHYKIFKERAL